MKTQVWNDENGNDSTENGNVTFIDWARHLIGLLIEHAIFTDFAFSDWARELIKCIYHITGHVQGSS